MGTTLGDATRTACCKSFCTFEGGEAGASSHFFQIVSIYMRHVRQAATCTAIEMAAARARVCYHADRPSSNLGGFKVRFRARVRRLRLRRQPVPVPGGEVLGRCSSLEP
jgi:hypothetical protein